VRASGAIAVVVAALVTASATPAHSLDSAPPAVTLIGDSVAEALPGDAAALRVLGQGISLDLEVAPCRRLTGTSCPPGPPTALDVITSEGSAIAPTVVIAVGYNDYELEYAAEIEQVLGALDEAGVRRVFWLTLREASGPYPAMNAAIAAAAARHPNVSVVDWNTYARGRPEWFQADGLHLLGPGSEAMAALIHAALLEAGVAVPPVTIATTALPEAHALRAYRARFVASGGRAPYSWSLAGRVPRGLHLLASGRLTGIPRRPAGSFAFTIRVKDAIGQIATRRLAVRVR